MLYNWTFTLLTYSLLLTFGSCDVVGHVTIRLAIGYFLPFVGYTSNLATGIGESCALPQRVLADGIDLCMRLIFLSQI